MTSEVASPATDSVAGTLSRLDRGLPIWIAAAMTLGLLAGRAIPGFATVLVLIMRILGWTRRYEPQLPHDQQLVPEVFSNNGIIVS